MVRQQKRLVITQLGDLGMSEAAIGRARRPCGRYGSIAAVRGCASGSQRSHPG
jgi:hypothetical protein